MDVDAAKSWLAEHRITTVECCFADMWGVLCGRRIPVDHYMRVVAEGISTPLAPFLWSVGAEIEPTPAANPDNGYPNLHLVPDVASLRILAWEPATALCMMDALTEPGGPPSPYDTRGILRRHIAALDDLGYHARVASELEFYVCTPEWAPVSMDHRPFSLAHGSTIEPLMTDLRSALLAAGAVVESSRTEYGPGHMELNVSPEDPLVMADIAGLLRHAVKGLARRHHLRATFMPVPHNGESGSGHHVHLSLLDVSGTGVFTVSEDHVLNEAMRAAVGGILRNMAEFTAVYLPSINAYKRLADYSFAPNRVCWAFDNRTAAVRIPPARGAGTRLEFRPPSSDANAYLMMAGLLASVTDGLVHGLAAPPPVADAYKRQDLERLPVNLGAAIDRFAASTAAAHAFGAEFVDVYAQNGRREEERFAAHVTDWERDRYLDTC